MTNPFARILYHTGNAKAHVHTDGHRAVLTLSHQLEPVAPTPHGWPTSGNHSADMSGGEDVDYEYDRSTGAAAPIGSAE